MGNDPAGSGVLQSHAGLTSPALQAGVGMYRLQPTRGPVVRDGDGGTTSSSGDYGTIGAAVGIQWPF